MLVRVALALVAEVIEALAPDGWLTMLQAYV